MQKQSTAIERHSEESEERRRDWKRLLFTGAGVIVLGVISFSVFTIERNHYLMSQADSFARTVIRSSPVVETNLGEVQRINEITEQHKTGNNTGWKLNYKVIGSRGDGDVDILLAEKRNFDHWGVPPEWNMPLASLEMGNKSINLR